MRNTRNVCQYEQEVLQEKGFKQVSIRRVENRRGVKRDVERIGKERKENWSILEKEEAEE